jgi:hypothetical protein
VEREKESRVAPLQFRTLSAKKKLKNKKQQEEKEIQTIK